MNESSGIPLKPERSYRELQKGKVVIDKRAVTRKKWITSKGSEESTRQITTLLLTKTFQEFIKFLRLTGQGLPWWAQMANDLPVMQDMGSLLVQGDPMMSLSS